MDVEEQFQGARRQVSRTAGGQTRDSSAPAGTGPELRAPSTFELRPLPDIVRMGGAKVTASAHAR